MKKIKNTLVAGTLVATTAVTAQVGQAQQATVTIKQETKKQEKIKKKRKWINACLRRQGDTGHPHAVQRWKRKVAAVLYDQGLSCRYVPGVLNQIQQESGGNPRAVNNWDINARNGVPSKGLIQTIAPTYTYYAPKGKKSLRYHMRPYANIYAGVSYAVHRYGEDKLKSWNRGYNQGY